MNYSMRGSDQAANVVEGTKVHAQDHVQYCMAVFHGACNNWFLCVIKKSQSSQLYTYAGMMTATKHISKADRYVILIMSNIMIYSSQSWYWYCFVIIMIRSIKNNINSWFLSNYVSKGHGIIKDCMIKHI